MPTEVDKRARSNVGNAQTSEEIRNLSPIEEESESMLRFHEWFGNFMINEPKRCGRKTRCSREEHRRLSKRATEGTSSSDDERMKRDQYRLKKVASSYCCLRPGAVSKEAEASGDNDEAETGHRDKSSETTVEQLKCRLSQVEREIVALKGCPSPLRCPGHERCEKLWQDLLIWRDDHEKRIDSHIARWQMTERKEMHDEMEHTRSALYGGIQRHLNTLLRRSAKARSDFRRQIDVLEKRLKRDVVGLHESNLMALREQFKTWYTEKSLSSCD